MLIPSCCRHTPSMSTEKAEGRGGGVAWLEVTEYCCQHQNNPHLLQGTDLFIVTWIPALGKFLPPELRYPELPLVCVWCVSPSFPLLDASPSEKPFLTEGCRSPGRMHSWAGPETKSLHVRVPPMCHSPCQAPQGTLRKEGHRRSKPPTAHPGDPACQGFKMLFLPSESLQLVSISRLRPR